MCALHRTLTAGAVAALALGHVSAWAGPAPAFPDLLKRSETAAPRLLEAEANLRAAEGWADQARAFPNPTLGVQVEDIGLKDAGVSQRQNTFTVSQPIELGGKRSARIGAARGDLAAAQARRRLAEADFGYDLALAYSSAEAAQVRVTVLSDDIGRARDDLKAARALVEAGKEADLRAVQAQASVSAAEAELATARGDLAEALAHLTSMAGSQEPFTEITAPLLARPSGFVAGSPASFAVTAARAEREAAIRRVSAERAKAIPDLNVSVGARTYENSDTTAMVVGVSAPFPLFDRNRGAVKAAGAQLAAADARLMAASLETEGAWRTAGLQATASAARATAAEQSVSAAGEAYRLARIAYDGGKSSLIELSAARRALVEANLALLNARLARVRAEAQLARLSGQAPFKE